MFDLHYFESLESTMDVVRKDAFDKTEGYVVQAGEQISGRGRRGNEWSSPKGNLYQSILLRPIVPREKWGELSFVIAVSLAQSCLEIGIDKSKINLKWPNDVLLNGQKLAGILLETGTDFVIVGTGVNIKSCPSDRSKIHNYIELDRDDFRDVFLKYIQYYYQAWQKDGFKVIHDKWMEYAYRLGDIIEARLPNNIFIGTFEGMDNQGTLLLRLKDGSLKKIHSGEIINVPSD